MKGVSVLMLHMRNMTVFICAHIFPRCIAGMQRQKTHETITLNKIQKKNL